MGSRRPHGWRPRRPSPERAFPRRRGCPGRSRRRHPGPAGCPDRPAPAGDRGRRRPGNRGCEL
uniref:Uncharacterized protein n=1 Tax=Litorilinea aerophila TaxID=1204385 RepID=A0A540VFB0_9CHLR